MVASGQQLWQAGVRPLTYNSMRVADRAAASVLRTVAGCHALLSTPFFQPLASGWVGIEPAVVVVVSLFLQTYQKQLHHANIMVRRSTQHGLYKAMQRCHPGMPCVCRGLSRHCRAHNMDHARFVFYMHVIGFHICLPPVHPEQGVDHVMCRAVHAWQIVAIHDWMDAGYFSLGDAHAARWPLAPWQWDLERLSPWLGVSIPLQPVLPVLKSVPQHVAFVTDDGSWFPSHLCGGAFAVVCLETHTWVVYPVSVPCHLDHSYAVEVYKFWILYIWYG